MVTTKLYVVGKQDPLPPPATLMWVDDGPYRWPSFRDPVSGSTLMLYTAYFDSLVADKSKKFAAVKATTSLIEAAVYALRSFENYLRWKNINLARVNDDILLDFREFSLSSVLSNNKSRGSKHAQMRTVNIKLRRIYHFFHWAQKSRLLPKGIIGALDCRIKSSLPESDTRASAVDLMATNKYPHLYDGVGENSRTNEGQHWATEEEIDAVEDYFWQTAGTLGAVRNCLMLRIMEKMGLRVESVNSFVISQFSDSAIKERMTNDGDFSITPSKQKLGHVFPFNMEAELALYIKNYIEDDETGRAAILRQAGAREKNTDGRVFISLRDATPLGDRTCVQIFADAFRAVGAPRGAGSHALRRYQAVETALTKIAWLRANNLPVTREAVEREVMEKLGHSSSEAQRAYVKAMAAWRKTSPEDRLRRQNTALQLENDGLRAAQAAQQQRLDKLEKGLKESLKRRVPRKRTTAPKPS